jgi:hypothetical protein
MKTVRVFSLPRENAVADSSRTGGGGGIQRLVWQWDGYLNAHGPASILSP